MLTDEIAEIDETRRLLPARAALTGVHVEWTRERVAAERAYFADWSERMRAAERLAREGGGL